MNILDILFPKSCCICSKNGEYMCERCRKTLKRNLPECYICRKISPHYKTHLRCRQTYTYDSVFVGWEYNNLSSNILKKFKYSGVYDIESTLLCMVDSILKDFEYIRDLRNSLVIPVPISNSRLMDRGFNQTVELAKHISSFFNFNFVEDLLMNIDDSNEHQALKDREERRFSSFNKFVVNENYDLAMYDSILVVDDVITTGATIEQISKKIREHNKDIPLNAFCLFRGKPVFFKN